MAEVIRTPDRQFEGLEGFDFAPRYLEWNGLRMHYLDERPAGPPRGTFLLLHGEPTWCHLYRDWIPFLVERGFRCIAPDHFGFGRSDKPADDEWYTIERHCQALRHLIDALDLSDVHLMVQDWGGPIGLRQAVDQPDRFARLFIANTWLHHEGMPYSEGVRSWRAAAIDPQKLGGDMPTGRIVAGSLTRPGHDKAAVARAYDAPFTGYASKAGARRFPLCIPFGEPELGNASQQQRCFDALARWNHCPVHLFFGDADPVFSWDWAERWAAIIPGATLDRIEGAGHFVQLDAPADCLAVIDRHLRGDAG